MHSIKKSTHITQKNHRIPVELKALQFITKTYDEIVASSAFELTSCRQGGSLYGTVLDPRGGASRYANCETCHQSEVLCPGHMGHMFIDSPVLHPLFLQNAVDVLRLICRKCHRLLVNRNRLLYSNVLASQGARRFLKISKLKGNFCVHCSTPASQYVLSSHNPKPGSNAPKIRYIHYRCDLPNSGTVDIPMSDAEIADILEDVNDEDKELLGIDPATFLIRVWPVIPLRCTKQNESGSHIDDLISLLRDMVKMNAIAKDERCSDIERHLAQCDLREKLHIFVSNHEKKKSSNADRGKPIDGVMDRLRGKRGLVRYNLTGKRCFMTIRAVIDPDPTLGIDEIRIPKQLADTITVPVHVHSNNLQECYNLIRDGKASRVERGDVEYNIELNRTFKLEPASNTYQGDILFRRLQDGDIVLLNRQPTLHGGSMMAGRAVIREVKTIGLPVAATHSYAADFDGDQMNGCIPQSIETTIELIALSSVHNMFVIGNKANICFVQDTLMGAYLMTKEKLNIPKDVVYQILFHMVGNSHTEYMQRLKDYQQRLNLPSDMVNSCMLISLIFPSSFSFESANGEFVIDKGLITKGCLTKQWLGANSSSLLKNLLFQYGSVECVKFCNRINFCTVEFLKWRGFSVDADDFMYAGDNVASEVRKTLIEAQIINETVKNPKLRDYQVRCKLDMAKDIGMNIVKDATHDSNISVMIESGSKGDYFNIGQIRGTLAQQTLDGNFIVPSLNGGRRSTIHYNIAEKDPFKLFESTGFISSSFSRGLNPREILFHAMTGREGVCTSATLTSVSGYIYRRTNKFCEDIVVRSDHTVGDRNGKIYDFAYGGTGLKSAFVKMNYDHVIEKIGGIPRRKRQINGDDDTNDKNEHNNAKIRKTDSLLLG